MTKLRPSKNYKLPAYRNLTLSIAQFNKLKTDEKVEYATKYWLERKVDFSQVSCHHCLIATISGGYISDDEISEKISSLP
jgi:hypothetical protein